MTEMYLILMGQMLPTRMAAYLLFVSHVNVSPKSTLST